MKHWSVEIKIDGESILHLSHNELSGVDNVIDYTDEIRTCALNLLGFIGESEAAYKVAKVPKHKHTNYIGGSEM